MLRTSIYVVYYYEWQEIAQIRCPVEVCIHNKEEDNGQHEIIQTRM